MPVRTLPVCETTAHRIGFADGTAEAGAGLPTALAAAVVLVSVLLAGCGPRYVVVERSPQAYYQTGFPVQDASRELERIQASIERIHFTAEYRTYVFTKEAAVTAADDLLSPEILGRAVETLTETESKAGSATVVARAPRGVALLTNHHVVHYPTHQVQYFDERPEGRRRQPDTRRVASISIRTRERGALADHPELGAFSVMSRDTVNDLALIEVRLPQTVPTTGFAVMPAPLGDPTRLSWGSFVYVFGYPRGYAMLTFGIVSDPNRDRRGSFLTNGLWNEGISGGAILAIRGSTGRLEWVGIARGGAGMPELRIEPRAGVSIDETDVPFLYQGPFFVNSIMRIQYGIAFSVAMPLIRTFVSRNEPMLRSRGYDLRQY